MIDALLSRIRRQGWVVAVHNDYHQDGEFHTFWLFTHGNRCFKGEGETDEAALLQVWEQIDAAKHRAGNTERGLE